MAAWYYELTNGNQNWKFYSEEQKPVNYRSIIDDLGVRNQALRHPVATHFQHFNQFQTVLGNTIGRDSGNLLDGGQDFRALKTGGDVPSVTGTIRAALHPSPGFLGEGRVL
jgi:hypothetical protein